jgi:hypothetical protein
MIELNGKASEHYDRRKNGALNGTSELVKERNFCPRGSILAATEIMQLPKKLGLKPRPDFDKLSPSLGRLFCIVLLANT